MPKSSEIEISQFLETEIVGRPLLHFKKLPSTMDETRSRAENGAAEGLVIVAEEQEAGRGRFDRKWVSPPNKNLYFSILLKPKPEQLPRINMAISLGIIDGIKAETKLKPTIKWPNDLRLKRRKLCGILIEGKVSNLENSYLIVGIGINVNLKVALYPELVPIATSILEELGIEYSRPKLLSAVLNNIEKRYISLNGNNTILQEWKSLLDNLGKRVNVRIGDSSEAGIAKDVDRNGNLILEREDGSKLVVPAGEIIA